MPGPLLATPENAVSARSEACPVVPSIFQIAPAAPPGSPPNCPFMNCASGPPTLRRTGLPSASGSDDTICKPKAEVAPGIEIGRTAILAAVEGKREDLPDVLRLDRQLYRGRDRAALRRTSERGKIEHGKRRRIDVDHRLVDGRNSRRQAWEREHRSRETGHCAVARREAECGLSKTRGDSRRKQANQGRRQSYKRECCEKRISWPAPP